MVNKLCDRVIVIGTKTQLRQILKKPDIVDGISLERKVEFCSSTNYLFETITNCEIGENESKWNLPEKVYYTGQIRQYDEQCGYGMTVDDPEWIKERLEEYGIKEIVKINVPRNPSH